MSVLLLVVWARRGFDVVHAHNPPDAMFVIGGFYKLFRKKFVFDRHDASPEVYEARYGADARPVIGKILRMLERSTFRTADHVVSTNESHRTVALSRGGVDPASTTIVRNGPETD